MRIIFPFVALLCLIEPTLGDKPKNAGGDKWAILIGVDDYLNAGDLKFCGADQKALRDELVSCGFDERQVFLLCDDVQDKKLLPFRANVIRQIETVLGFAESGDFVLIGFSGHGVHLGKTSYLCPTDAKLDDPTTLVSLDWVYDKLQKCKADLRLVMVDACRNDPRPEGQRTLSNGEIRDGTRAFVEASNRLPDGVILLNSCSEGEVSQEDKAFGHGVFMHFVLQGLKGAADRDGDKSVTLDELVKYSSKETKLYVEKKYNDSQRPKLRGNYNLDAMDVALAKLTTSRPSLSSNPPLPNSSPSTSTSSTGGQFAGTKAGDRRELMSGVAFRWCPAGSFTMGSPKSELGYNNKREDDEDQVEVKLTQGYWLQETELTQGQWASLQQTSPWRGNDNVREGSSYPATYVSWEDAVIYCEKLTRQEQGSGSLPGGWKYSLPTEAQWEYACRSGTRTKHSFGESESELRQHAWYDKNALDIEEQYAHEVGQKGANAWGLRDMHGNVLEWCSDWYGSTLGGGSDPTGASSGSKKVTRGGDWSDNAADCRSADRSRHWPGHRFSNLGFRLAAIPE